MNCRWVNVQQIHKNDSIMQRIRQSSRMGTKDGAITRTRHVEWKREALSLNQADVLQKGGGIHRGGNAQLTKYTQNDDGYSFIATSGLIKMRSMRVFFSHSYQPQIKILPDILHVLSDIEVLNGFGYNGKKGLCTLTTASSRSVTAVM